jgi:hypothetical protein
VDGLLHRVRSKINGANIHDVNGMIGVYNASKEMEINLYGRKYLAWSLSVLSEFADTGDIKQAKLNHPYPRELKMQTNKEIVSEELKDFFHYENNVQRFNQKYHGEWEKIRDDCMSAPKKSNKVLAWTQRRVDTSVREWYKYL